MFAFSCKRCGSLCPLHFNHIFSFSPLYFRCQLPPSSLPSENRLELYYRVCIFLCELSFISISFCFLSRSFYFRYHHRFLPLPLFLSISLFFSLSHAWKQAPAPSCVCMDLRKLSADRQDATAAGNALLWDTALENHPRVNAMCTLLWIPFSLSLCPCHCFFLLRISPSYL